MMRRRHEKARTGCQTCKSRRVKCDEGRPSCQRCISSRRECRGYQPTPANNFSWQQLLQWRQPCLPVDAAEGRSLSYYHRVVATSLARSLDDTFWAIHVPQVVDKEPAARHAALAISALHEDFDATLLNRALGPLDVLTAHTTRVQVDKDSSSRYTFALHHYNSAIRMVIEDRVPNIDTLLTVSLLFTCIELLQGGTNAAAKHCQHGFHLYSNLRLPSELSAAFHQLSVFPQLFGNLTLPRLASSQGESRRIIVDEMHTVVQARRVLDAIMARGANLLRLTEDSGDGAVSNSMEDLKTEQFEIHRALGLWWEGFAALRCRSLSTASTRESDAAVLRLLETRWLVTNILANCCLSNKETIFDEYLDEFQRIVGLAEQEEAARRSSGLRLPSFSFDMGYLPLLYIVSTKCRQLRLRVRALVLLRDLSCARETIWDSSILWATGKWVTEYEHALELDEERMRSTTNLYPDEKLPCDAKRIVGYNNTDETSLDVDSAGYAVVRRRIWFHVSGPDGVVGPLFDYTTMRL